MDIGFKGFIYFDATINSCLSISRHDALNKVTERYRKAGKKIHLRHLSEDCVVLLNNASEIIEVNYWEDPHYKVIENKLEG